MNDRRRFLLERTGIMGLTTLLAFSALAFRDGSGAVELREGLPSPQDFFAERPIQVENEERTRQLHEEAAASEPPVFARDAEIEDAVYGDVDLLFADVQVGVFEERTVPDTTTSLPIRTTTTTPDPEPDTVATTTTIGDSATTTAPVPLTEVVGQLFLDADGDGVFEPSSEETPGDAGLGNVDILVIDGEGRLTRGQTQGDGTYRISGVVAGEIEVRADRTDPDLPQGFASRYELSTGNDPQTLECGPDSSCEAEPIGFAPRIRPLEEQMQDLQDRYPNLRDNTRATLVMLAVGDVVRAALDEDPYLNAVQQAAVARIDQIFQQGLYSREDVQEAAVAVNASQPPVFIGQHRDTAAAAAAANIVGLFLEPNYEEDEGATEAAVQAAMQAVEPVMVTFRSGESIARQGDELTQVHIDAIRAGGLLQPEPPRRLALLGIVAVVVAMLAFYLARFRTVFWERTRMVVLFGVLLVLAAATVRLTTLFEQATGSFVLPAVAFGFMAAILFDARIGVLMAMAMGMLTAIGTLDPGLAVYAVLSAMAPIPFVSSISTRGDTRRAVLYSSGTAALLAGAVAWFFEVGPDRPFEAVVVPTVAWAFGSALVASLVGLAALSFFEVIFDITTALRLLDVTDRNHPALELLQQGAWGTFNHSLMVGTLAETAAKAIGANSLLARAAAYYHDLGKTENPSFFIENQFGISNPHDELPPEKSVEILRRHVTDGVELARRYRIPSEVVAGIVSHHGDSVMRYFYERARQLYGADAVNTDDYRHTGRKPDTKETAILMLADSLEGACRAVFQLEDPSPERIAQVVDGVMGEKIDDGQLSNSPLTMGELTRVRLAFIEALVGHYHQRIPYPNFPGRALPAGGPAVRPGS